MSRPWRAITFALIAQLTLSAQDKSRLSNRACVSPMALDGLKAAIAYSRTVPLNFFKGVTILDARVWSSRDEAVFYFDQRLPPLSSKLRLAYLFRDAESGFFTCSSQEGWRRCARDQNGQGDVANQMERTCTLKLDVRSIPSWAPSPDSESKRKLTAALRTEIESQWPNAKQIIVRDFNVNDTQIMMLIGAPDGEYFQGCGFRAGRIPHCEGWHSFGTVPLEPIRRRILDLPLKLK